ncbi:hypothetical protein INR49_027121 [Caranx melampygus]|nr:hypothetical protein INR49_027121 [Caranx melampygus]
MIGSGLLVLTVLSSCVLSLPVTSGQLENEDVKVMKCIVEALADVLSRPHPVPISQECLVILKTDDRLVTILRHHNFLKELQEIALQDRSMLEALGGPGERSILLKTRRTGDGKGEKDETQRDGGSHEDTDINEEVEVKREDDESPEGHLSESVDEWSEGKTEKREEEQEEEEGYVEKKANSEEENKTKEKKAFPGAMSNEKRDAPGNKSKEKKFDVGEEEQEDKSPEEGKVKRGGRENLKRWTKRGKSLEVKRTADGKEPDSQQEDGPHHSKEVTEDEKKRDPQRSPEEKELQMIARRPPEERRVSEEEGSASRKAEEPEIESLAAIESELENVAQKLHELRRG